MIRLVCRRLKADSEKETDGLDAGLKASTTRKRASVDFFRNL
jgi:hypothetical protein